MSALKASRLLDADFPGTERFPNIQEPCGKPVGRLDHICLAQDPFCAPDFRRFGSGRGGTRSHRLAVLGVVSSGQVIAGAT